MLWFQADAVVDANTSKEAWEIIAKLALREAKGHSSRGLFSSGGMTMVPDGAHLIEPLVMTQEVEDGLVSFYHKALIEQGDQLVSEEYSDPVYSMMIGFAFAHHLRINDARKLAQRLYRGITDIQQRRGKWHGDDEG